MVLGGAAFLQNADAAAGVGGGRAQHFQELSFADMEGAGAGYQHSAGAQHLQGTQVKLLVAAQGGGTARLVLAKAGGSSTMVSYWRPAVA